MLYDHKLKKVWLDREMFSLPLLTMFLDMYGVEGLSWTPETIQMEIEQDIGSELPDEVYDRLMTGINILTDNSFFNSVYDFARMCVILSGHHIPANMMILPDSDDCAWGITEAILISPPEDDNQEPFSKEIIAFLGYVLDREGIITPPDVLRIAVRDSDLSEHVNYNYSDDPELFSGIQKFELDKTNSINKMIKSNMRKLLTQLKMLPVRNGKTEQLATKLLEGLPKEDEEQMMEAV